MVPSFESDKDQPAASLVTSPSMSEPICFQSKGVGEALGELLGDELGKLLGE